MVVGSRQLGVVIYLFRQSRFVDLGLQQCDWVRAKSTRWLLVISSIVCERSPSQFWVPVESTRAT